MKEFDLILKLSFVSYPAFALAIPYVTARAWADCLVFVFGACVLYQLIYIIFLRRKENVSLSRSIARTSLYMTVTVSATVVGYYIYIFFFGFTYDFFMIHNVYYGFEAWKNCFMSIVYVPLLIINAVYRFLYCHISRKKAHSGGSV
jgi:hypothetical protein